MSLHGTQRYENLRDSVPLRVRSAVEGARRLEFGFCVRPEIGRLLAVLAGGLPPGARVGETGTGTGAGLAWMVDAARVHWLTQPALDATEIRVAPDLAVVMGRRYHGTA